MFLLWNVDTGPVRGAFGNGCWMTRTRFRNAVQTVASVVVYGGDPSLGYYLFASVTALIFVSSFVVYTSVILVIHVVRVALMWTLLVFVAFRGMVRY